MPSIIIEGTPEADVAREDGSPYPYALIQGSVTIYCDGPGDVIAHLIEGYGDIPETPEGDDQALIARVQQAIHIATFIQAAKAHDKYTEGLFDPENESEEVTTALFADRTIPVLVDEWNHEVPLVLITTDYAPYVNANTPPKGNVWWVDPSDEALFVHSLNALGVIQVYVHEDA